MSDPYDDIPREILRAINTITGVRDVDSYLDEGYRATMYLTLRTPACPTPSDLHLSLAEILRKVADNLYAQGA